MNSLAGLDSDLPLQAGAIRTIRATFGGPCARCVLDGGDDITALRVHSACNERRGLRRHEAVPILRTIHDWENTMGIRENHKNAVRIQTAAWAVGEDPRLLANLTAPELTVVEADFTTAQRPEAQSALAKLGARTKLRASRE